MAISHITFSASGRQYRVKSGDKIIVNRINAAVGDTVALGNAIAVEDEGGAVRVGDDAAKISLTATVAEHTRGEKLRVFKMRRRKASRRSAGHRQDLTHLVIGDFPAA